MEISVRHWDPWSQEKGEICQAVWGGQQGQGKCDSVIQSVHTAPLEFSDFVGRGKSWRKTTVHWQCLTHWISYSYASYIAISRLRFHWCAHSGFCRRSPSSPGRCASSPTSQTSSERKKSLSLMDTSNRAVEYNVGWVITNYVIVVSLRNFLQTLLIWRR